jgi:NitT/TauT family transport system substrate-binding protein
MMAFAAATVFMALVAPVAQAQAQGKPLTDVTLNLDFISLGRHAPWYVALAKGYYKEAGLNVKIVPGQGTAQALQALETNVAQFAFSDVTSLVIARSHGASTAKFVAMNYQKAPYAVFSLDPGANVTTPEKLQGLEIASGAGSFTPKVIEGFMKERKLDPSTVKYVNVDGSARVGMMVSGKVPAVETYIFARPGIERSLKGPKLATLFFADHGLELYSNGLLARDAYIKSHPEIVRAFVQASLRGWKDALANPAEAARLEAEYVKGLNPDVVVAEIGILKELAVTPDVKAHGYGAIDPAMMKKSLDFVVNNIGIQGTAPAVNAIYTTEFLPKAPILP